MLLCLCPVGCLSSAFLNWDRQQGRDRAMSGRNKRNQLGQSYSYIMRKVWYISSNLNSKLFRFHRVRPNMYFTIVYLFLKRLDLRLTTCVGIFFSFKEIRIEDETFIQPSKTSINLVKVHMKPMDLISLMSHMPKFDCGIIRIFFWVGL